MKQIRRLAAITSVLALACLSMASMASATTLEVGGVAKNEAITLKLSLKSGTSLLLADTSNSFLNTCTVSNIEAKTSTFSGTTVEALLTALSWGTTATPCKEGNPTVDAMGSLSIELIKGTTNGTVKSKNAKWTMASAFGPLTCTTPSEGTDLGTLTGVASGNATLDVNAVLNCGFTLKWTGTYAVTSPEGLGVTDSNAPSTRLEVGGVAKNESVAINASLKAGTTSLLADTFGFFANTCTTSTVEGEATPSGSVVSGPVNVLSWGTTATPCKEGNPTVDAKGSLSVERIGTTTNGTVKSKNAKVTVPSALGTLTCETPSEGTDLGTITGVASGTATLDVAALLSCGSIPTKWTATYTVTSPEGLGVTS
jgi:hypothetical protein